MLYQPYILTLPQLIPIRAAFVTPEGILRLIRKQDNQYGYIYRNIHTGRYYGFESRVPIIEHQGQKFLPGANQVGERVFPIRLSFEPHTYKLKGQSYELSIGSLQQNFLQEHPNGIIMAHTYAGALTYALRWWRDGDINNNDRGAMAHLDAVQHGLKKFVPDLHRLSCQILTEQQKKLNEKGFITINMREPLYNGKFGPIQCEITLGEYVPYNQIIYPDWRKYQ